MEKLLELLRIWLISIEMLALIASACLFHWFPQLTTKIGVIAGGYKLLWWSFLGFTCLYTANTLRNILFPSEKMGKVLQEWPDYWKLKYRALSALLFCVLCTVFAVAVIVLGASTGLVGFAVVSSILVAFISMASQYLASISIGELGGQID